jgi:hypothetical protein
VKSAAAVLPLLLAAATSGADTLPDRAVHVADYAIDVRLDAAKKTLEGRERVTWRNPSPDTVGEIWLHLYLNAFRNTESTFFKESGGQLRGDQMPENGWGSVEITSLRRRDGADLTKAIRFEHPDDDNDQDRTVVRVPLAEPVPPGGEAQFDVEWTSKLPRIFARTGYVRDYFLVGQWFPKLGVYEPAGLRGRASGGWNCHQFHANSEFYADFGVYRVSITLPADYVVGATGHEVERRTNPDGTATHVFEQADVIDFAWTASPRFVDVQATFDAEKDVTPAEYATAAKLLGRTPDEVKLQNVAIRVLLQPGHRPQADRHVAAVKNAIKWFGLWYGRYPYPTITVVDPAPGGGGSGGMEYPTFITAGTSFLMNRWPFDRVLAPEEVTVHEFGHQYWQSMVATNEFEESWLDEGFNSYSTAKAMERSYGPWMIQLPLGLRLGGLEMSRMQNSRDRAFDAIRTKAWGFSPGNYSFNSYSRTELTLDTLESILGEQAMARAMRTYHERFRFRHPSSDDFYATVAEVAGRDMRWFFDETVEKPGIVDYEVASVRTERMALPRGLVGDGPSPRLVTDEEAAKAEKEKDASGDGRPWRSTVVVRRRGEVAGLPVVLRLSYEGGGHEDVALEDAPGRPWTGRWTKVERTGKKRLVSATVDPDGTLVLDVNRLDDGRRTRSDGRAAAAWGTRLVFWLQQALALAGM